MLGGLSGRPMLSKNTSGFWDRAAGDVCRGQKALCTFNEIGFSNFLKFEKPHSGEKKTFSTRLGGLSGSPVFFCTALFP